MATSNMEGLAHIPNVYKGVALDFFFRKYRWKTVDVICRRVMHS